MIEHTFRRAIRRPLRAGAYDVVPLIMRATEEGDRLSQARLFHYTRIENFSSICRSRSIWMGRCLDTNDSEEISFAVEVLDSHIRDNYSDHPAANAVRRSFDEMVHSIPVDIYFASFTNNDDLLSQWRGYSPGDGVSFGFSFKHLRAISIEYGLRLGPVLYKYDDQLSMIDSIAKDMLSAGNSRDDKSSALRSRAFLGFLTAAPFIKHAAFSEESEWRIVYVPDGMSRLVPVTKAIGGGIRAIIELPIESKLYLPSDVFGAVTLSPTLSTMEGFAKIEDLLKSNELTSTLIKFSSIPYQRSKW